jgi:acyl-ACP thioesterase
MDTSTGKPVKLPDGYNDYELDPPYQMEYLGRKIDINSDFTELPSFPVLKQNIDTYNHVNNGQYIKMAEEYLPDNFIASKMRVEYRMSAVYGDIIVPKLSKSYNKYTIILANTLGSPYSIIEFKA